MITGAQQPVFFADFRLHETGSLLWIPALAYLYVQVTFALSFQKLLLLQDDLSLCDSYNFFINFLSFGLNFDVGVDYFPKSFVVLTPFSE